MAPRRGDTEVPPSVTARERQSQLRVLQVRGRLGEAELAELSAEAEKLGQSPLELLWRKGRISQELQEALRAAAMGATLEPTENARPASPIHAVALAATVLQPGPRPASDPTSPESGDSCSQDGVPAFPIVGWDRYKPIRVLGQGGMGTVFLAHDLRLGREVAIKFVRRDDPVNVARLLAEARAQARVDHERVCKVYEVGEKQGESYIAMQYIAGQTLGVLGRALSVEQKAVLLRDAALGVHEAHRAGILHRDIKPANIMVERGEDGSLKAYVMDFGLARALDEGATESASVLGTPHYMPPEQARGEVSSLDRRADVYSLGASLYYLLTQTPPIPGNNGLEVLNNIASFEPVPPRSLDRDIPADLEAITLKCLEKERSSRYDSARALARDLDSFLRGDPVEARATGLGYRLRKRLSKHKRLVTAAILAVTALLLALAYAISAQQQATTREHLAQRFTELVERIESKARYAALSPAHDARDDQAMIRRSMSILESDIERAGALGAGPGNYALGRGYMALGDDVRARVLLESAWTMGYRQPRVAYALALVFGRLYAERQRQVQLLQDAEQRDRQQREIEVQYRDPALHYLRRSEGAEVPSKAYVAALMAFYDGRHDVALQALDRIGANLPWFYEAPELRGDVLQARAALRWNTGNRDGALSDFDAGRKAYAEAIAIGRSVPTLYYALGELEYAALLMELYGAGDVKPRVDRGLEAVGQALAIQPDDAASYVLKAAFYRKLAEHDADRGAQVGALLTEAIAAAKRAVELAPRLIRARTELGSAYYQRGADLEVRALDPRDDLQHAIDALAEIAAEARDYDFHLMRGVIYQTWADYEDHHGLDSLARRAQGVEAYGAATRLDPRQIAAWINLGSSYFTRASTPRSPNPGADLEQALKALEQARSLNPKHVVPYFYENMVHTLRGRRARATGADPQGAFDAALAASEQGMRINPNLWHLHAVKGLTLLELAHDAFARGDDPAPLLERALVEQELAVHAAPEQHVPHVNLGVQQLWRARYQRATGKDSSVSARRALSALQRATALAPDDAEAWAYQSQTQVFLAEQALELGRDASAHLSLAAETSGQALKSHASFAEALLATGQWRAVSALLRARAGKRADAELEEAVKALEKLIAVDPSSPEQSTYLRYFGQFCSDWAALQQRTRGAPGPLLQRGLDLAQQVIETRPQWADGYALRAELLLTKALATDTRSMQASLAGAACEDFALALGVNANLQHSLGAPYASARALLRER